MGIANINGISKKHNGKAINIAQTRGELKHNEFNIPYHVNFRIFNFSVTFVRGNDIFGDDI